MKWFRLILASAALAWVGSALAQDMPVIGSKQAAPVILYDLNGYPLFNPTTHVLNVSDVNSAAIAASLSTLVNGMNNPIAAQTTHGVNIGGIEGITVANNPGTYPVTVQPQSGGFAVLPATNSAGTVSQVQSDSSAAISVSTATTTTLVALSSGKSIYVTAWDIVVAAADNVTLEYGTGTNCGTGTTALTGAYNFAANGGLAKGSGLGVLFKVPAGNALCIVTSAAVQASGSVSYAQF